MNTELKQMKKFAHFFNPNENEGFFDEELRKRYEKKLHHETEYYDYIVKEVRYGILF